MIQGGTCSALFLSAIFSRALKSFSFQLLLSYPGPAVSSLCPLWLGSTSPASVVHKGKDMMPGPARPLHGCLKLTTLSLQPPNMFFSCSHQCPPGAAAKSPESSLIPQLPPPTAICRLPAASPSRSPSCSAAPSPAPYLCAHPSTSCSNNCHLSKSLLLPVKPLTARSSWGVTRIR